jgi:hypothetical protein
MAATMVLQFVGRQEDKSLSGKAAIAAAERIMNRTLDEYSQSLLTFWKANANTVLFAIQKEGPLSRVGVSVVVPLTKEFYRRFRGGRAEDADITRDDIPTKSTFILIDAAVDHHDVDTRLAKSKRSMSQVRTVMYQLASLSPPLHTKDANPHVISFVGTPESRLRFKAYNFTEVGAKTRLSGKDVVEFAPPDKKVLGLRYTLAYANYLFMKATLLIYQASVGAQDVVDV